MKSSEDIDSGWWGTGLDAAELVEHVARQVTVNGRALLLTVWQGNILATSARCPHAGADLSAGELYRGRIDCPDHGWRFDLTTGRTLFPPDENCRLRRYSVGVRDGEVWVKIA